MPATPKQSSDLMTFFTQNCPKAPRFNRAVEKWAARDLIDSYGFDTCKQAVLWYAKVSTRQDWKHFLRIADDCVTESNLYKDDVAQRRKFRAIANEWRNS